MIKLPFAHNINYPFHDYPFKIKTGQNFLYNNKNFQACVMYIDKLDFDLYQKVYNNFLKDKCFGRNIPIYKIGTIKMSTDLTPIGLKYFYLFNAKFHKYVKELDITQTIFLNKSQLRSLANSTIEEIQDYLLEHYNIHNIVDGKIEIDLGKSTLSENCLLLANIYKKIIKKCNEQVDFGTNFYTFIDTLQLTDKEKALINTRLEKVDNTFFYLFD